MDDLRLYEKNDDDFEGLIINVNRFSDIIGMQFDLENVRKSHLRKDQQ